MTLILWFVIFLNGSTGYKCSSAQPTDKAVASAQAIGVCQEVDNGDMHPMGGGVTYGGGNS